MSECAFLEGYAGIHHWRASARWKIRWVLRFRLCSCTKTVKRRSQTKNSIPLNCQAQREKGRGYVFIESELLRLRDFPKPPMDQLCFDLPCLMGFRAKEVTTLRIEWINFETEDTLVLDAKKHELFLVPANRRFLRHAEQVLNGRSEGPLVVSESHRNYGEPLTTTAIWYKWLKGQKIISIYPYPGFYSPIWGRRLFIYRYIQDAMLPDGSLPVSTVPELAAITRHSDPEEVWRYYCKLQPYERVKAGYDRFQNMEERRRVARVQPIQTKLVTTQ